MAKVIATSQHFGRTTVCYGGMDWRYADDNTPVKDVADWPCGLCGGRETADGHDPCIASLPGVKFACCGHGVQRGYVMFEDGRVIRGQFDHVVEIERIEGRADGEAA